jgi:hypothetical protein
MFMLTQLEDVGPKVFLLQYGTREGRSANCFAILWITLLAGSTQNVPFGFLYEQY